MLLKDEFELPRAPWRANGASLKGANRALLWYFSIRAGRRRRRAAPAAAEGRVGRRRVAGGGGGGTRGDAFGGRANQLGERERCHEFGIVHFVTEILIYFGTTFVP